MPRFLINPNVWQLSQYHKTTHFNILSDSFDFIVLSFLLLFNDDISFVDFSRPVNDGDYFVYGVFALMVTYHLRACLK